MHLATVGTIAFLYKMHNLSVGLKDNFSSLHNLKGETLRLLCIQKNMKNIYICLQNLANETLIVLYAKKCLNPTNHYYTLNFTMHWQDTSYFQTRATVEYSIFVRQENKNMYIIWDKTLKITGCVNLYWVESSH